MLVALGVRAGAALETPSIIMNDEFDTTVITGAGRATLAGQIESLVARLHPTVAVERRHVDRIAIPALFRLTPFDADHQLLRSQASIVVGKNISRRGMSFYHERPMPHRRALIELAHPGLGEFVAEIDVSWCRFTRPGWYESGGRLLRSPLEDQILDGAGLGDRVSHALDFVQTVDELRCPLECQA